ncbi:MAG: hypothetical protein AB2A00_18795 [Myxococcota bacterium]
MVRAALLLAFPTLLACQTTQLVSVWSDPAARAVDLDKVLVVARTGDAATERTAEERLARTLPVEHAVAAHQLFSDAELANPAALHARLVQEGFDGVVVMRVVAVESVPQHAPTWTGISDFLGAYIHPTAPFDMEEHVSVETTVFSLPDDKLVWAGLTRSVDPRSLEDAAQGIARTVGRDLRRRGMLH